jgi:hypothetical protein
VVKFIFLAGIILRGLRTGEEVREQGAEEAGGAGGAGEEGLLIISQFPFPIPIPHFLMKGNFLWRCYTQY